MAGNHVDVIFSGHSISGDQEYIWNVDSSVKPGLYLIKVVMDDYVRTYRVMRK